MSLTALFLFAQAAISAEQMAQWSATLSRAQEFIAKQTDLSHSFDVAAQCEEALKSGNLPAGLPIVQKKYALSNIDARALSHDCSVYLLGRMSGGAEQIVQDAIARDRKK